jgi:hypothetical protein
MPDCLDFKISAVTLALVLSTLSGGNRPLLAQETALPDKFELNAQIDERPRLSTEDLQPSAGESSPGLSTGISHEEMPGALPLPELPETAGTAFGLTASQQAEAPQIAMAEYGVDWSSWISRLADLWFFNLRKATDRSEYEFHISTPTRVEFTCWPNGHITGISIKRSSGVPLYDQLQVEALKRTKCPPFPAGTQKTSYTLVLGWDSHPRQSPREQTFTPGSFDPGVTLEKIKQWIYWR